jgi:hypothetical protein
MAINLANNSSLANITALPSSISGGAMTLLATQTASSSSTISFTSGIDDTYDEYVFKFYNIHPETDNVTLQVGFRDGDTNYDAVKTSTAFRALHNEAGGSTQLAFTSGEAQAQSTDYQVLSLGGVGADADQCTSGSLTLFNPSSTTFVKHFIARSNIAAQDDYSLEGYVAGYCNTTAAIDGVQFKMSSGNIDSGVIKLYGVS